jgi:hypothetical protein
MEMTVAERPIDSRDDTTTGGMMTDTEQHRDLVARFVDEIWNDADMAWADDPSRVDDLISANYRPGYSRTLHWGWRLSEERTAVEWLAGQVGAYRDEYPDFELEIRHTLVDEGSVVTELAFRGTHATETFINRAGNPSPVFRSAQGIGWTTFDDGGIVRHAFFWEGGNFLGRDQ